MAKDYYKILGVAQGASKEEIKKAFHRLAHKHHPHKGGDAKTFKEINEAYRVLSDDQKRAQYDRFGQTFEGASNQGGDANWFWSNFNQGEPDINFDFGDEGLGDIFGEIFGFGKGKRQDPNKGEDIRVDVWISLKDVLTGVNKEINLKKFTQCKRCRGAGAEPGSKVNECYACRGTGQVQRIRRSFLGSFTQWSICPECHGEGKIPEKPCNVCKGEGRIKEEEKISFFIPSGVDNNQLIKIEGKGGAGKRGGKPGDLYIRILVKSHPEFDRRGDDFYAVCSIPFSKATLGGKIEITTLDGKNIDLKIPKGTSSGRVFRLSGKGIPHFSGYGRGDLYVKMKIETPKKINKKQKDLLEELKKQGL